ncbi:MAG: hypothetical protein ABJE10_01060 [bacterium]
MRTAQRSDRTDERNDGSSKARRATRIIVLAPVLAVALVATTRTRAAEAPTAATLVRVVARDYAFEAPDTVLAGEASFEFDNQAAQGPELLVGLLRQARLRATSFQHTSAG